MILGENQGSEMQAFCSFSVRKHLIKKEPLCGTLKRIKRLGKERKNVWKFREVEHWGCLQSFFGINAYTAPLHCKSIPAPLWDLKGSWGNQMSGSLFIDYGVIRKWRWSWDDCRIMWANGSTHCHRARNWGYFCMQRSVGIAVQGFGYQNLKSF